MPRVKSPIAVIAFTVFIDLVGFGIVIPILPLYAQHFGASPFTIGCIVGIYSAMQFICAPLLGKLSDRIGRRPVLLVSIAGTAVGFLLMGLARSLWMLFAARIIDGITGGNISTAQAYIADVTPPQQRSRAMGILGAAFGVGFIIGPAIGGLMSHFSIGAPFFFAAALAAANTLAVYFILPESLAPELRGHPHASAVPSHLGQLLRGQEHQALRRITITYFLVTVAFSMLTATYPLFASHHFGFGAPGIGFIFACIGLVGALVQGVFMGWLLKRTSDARLILAGIASLLVGFIWLPVTGAHAALMGATAAIAVGHGLFMAPITGMASRHAGASAQGRILGLMQATASLARLVGPVLGGFLLQYDALAATYGRTPYWAGAGILVGAFAAAAAL